MIDERSSTLLEQKRSSIISRLIKLQVVIAVLITIVSIFIGWQIPSLLRKKAQIENDLRIKGEELEKTKQDLEKSKSILLAINPILEKYGVLKKLSVDNLNSDVVKQSFDANQEIQLILARVYQGRQIPVWYYSKDVNVDPEFIKQSLEEFGFSVVSQHPQRPDLPTNNIAFGTNVRPEDAKLVAYTLIRAGIKIKALCGISAMSKASVIEVLGDERLVERPPLTVAQIRNQTSFVPCPADSVDEWPEK
jgi:hypothetical protein